MGHTWVYPIRIPLYLLGFRTTWVSLNPKNSCSKSKDDKISSIVARHGRPRGINSSTETSSTMDDGRLVLLLQASQRPTIAPILARLGVRSQDQDPFATLNTHCATAFATLPAPKCVAFVQYMFHCCVH